MPVDTNPLNLSGLPVVLVGPILRRLTRTSVSVWVATRLGDDISLHIRQSGAGGPASVVTVTPVRVGTNLWVSVLTAPGVDQGTFAAGQLYDYWLESPAWPAAARPNWVDLAFSYTGLSPRFAGLPDQIEHLDIAHTSCRKLHGHGRDGLAALDALIVGPTPRAAPNLLLLSGDQVYADDVATPLMPRIQRVAADLVGIDETGVFGPLPPLDGRQAPTHAMGFTSGSAHDHVWTFGEFLALYLLSWSNVLWPASLPGWNDLALGDLDAGSGLDEAGWDDLVDRLETARATMGNVRRIMANAPTLMMFDDHEVTDDWNLNHGWASQVYADQRGRRAITNGLMAYALCQHWGNVPARFAAGGTPEAGFLVDVTLANPAAPAHPDTPALRQKLGIPDAIPAAPAAFRDLSDAAAMRFDAQLGPADGCPASVILLDERTARHFPAADGPASRISGPALALMIPAPAQAPAGNASPPLIVVAPAPILGFRLIEHWIQPTAALLPGGLTDYDVEHWAAFGETLEALLERLSAYRRVVMLSGDVHYGFSKRMHYEKPVGTSVLSAVQFTTSSAKNADEMTLALHTVGDLTNQLGVVRPRVFDGFTQLSPAQRNSLATVPQGPGSLPYDDLSDIALGRVFREGTRSPAVFSHEVAQAYGLTNPNWRYRIDHMDDEGLPADPSDLAAMQAVANGAAWSGWNPSRSLETVRGLSASNRNRIGRVFQGLPQASWISFSGAPLTITNEVVMPAGRLMPEPPAVPVTQIAVTSVRLDDGVA